MLLFNAPKDYNFYENDVVRIETPSVEEIQHHTPFYRADDAFVYRYGDDFFRHALDVMSPIMAEEGKKFKYVSIDSRTHMLMKGMYPCIPYWHCDDFWRGDDGQPDLVGCKDKSMHYSFVVGETSFTEFLVEPLRLPLFKPKPGHSLYGCYNALLDTLDLKTANVKSGQVVRFSPMCFHRGVPADKNGWRTFVRFSFSNHREPKNQIRAQTQVYLSPNFDGW